MTERYTPSEAPAPGLVRSPLEALADELGEVAGQIERDANLRLTAALADLGREAAERELRFAKLERMIEDRLASLKDGGARRHWADRPGGICW